MLDLSIECAQPYGHEWDNDAAAQALTSLLSRARGQQQAVSLVLLVDDNSYEDKSFDFDQYSHWLQSKGFNPDLVAKESQIDAACNTLLANIDYEKLAPELADKLRSNNGRISQAFIAAWCLLRLGYLEDVSFDPSLTASSLVNILPQSFKPGEDESLDIIKSTRFADAADKIDYVFIPDPKNIPVA